MRFGRIGLEVEVPVGSSVLDAARAIGAPEGSHCGGVCACSTCHVYVLRGAEALAAMSDDEGDMLSLAARERRDHSRLGCQALIEVADAIIEVDISEESFQTFLDDNPLERERVIELWLARRPSS